MRQVPWGACEGISESATLLESRFFWNFGTDSLRTPDTSAQSTCAGTWIYHEDASTMLRSSITNVCQRGERYGLCFVGKSSLDRVGNAFHPAWQDGDQHGPQPRNR